MRTVPLLLLLLAASCKSSPSPEPRTPPLVGAWHAHVQFTSGAFVPIKDLEFLYVFHQGGTLTESSNYDSAPPVPPAYGEWRETAPDHFEARYTYFTSRTPGDSNGWIPSGTGVLTEQIVLAADGRSYDASLKLELFDVSGRPVAGGGAGAVHAQRAGF